MSKLVRLLLTALLLTMSLLAAGPATANDGDDDDGGGGGGDAVFGGGALAESPSTSFTVDVTSGPLGENPSGTFRVEFTQAGTPGGFIVAEATCLVVTGNTATVGGRITERSGVGFDPISFAVGRGVLFTTQDNSPATPAPDRVSGFQSVPVPPTTQASCVTQPMFFTVDGDVTVQDNIAGVPGDDDDGDDDDGDDD